MPHTISFIRQYFILRNNINHSRIIKFHNLVFEISSFAAVFPPPQKIILIRIIAEL